MALQVLNPDLYRCKEVNTKITRENVDDLLNRHMIQVRMRRDLDNGEPRYWDIRRNGSTRRWARDKNRIRIPFKAGMYVFGAITEDDFIWGDNA